MEQIGPARSSGTGGRASCDDSVDGRKKAKAQGILIILPDTALPFVAEAKKTLDELAVDPQRLAEFIKRVHEES
jgi:hypothetical protein